MQGQIQDSSNIADPGAVQPARRLKIIVYRDRYPTAFMTPRISRHDMVRTRFVPFNKLHSNWDGFTVTPPFHSGDLVHAWNRIPLGAPRYICSFESSLPRGYGFPHSSLLMKVMQRAIESKHCRRIVAMSHYAKRKFLQKHQNEASFEALRSKLMVRHPNVFLSDAPDALANDDCKTLTVTFIGSHFGRKGGTACVRAAELALERGLPIRFNIVSTLQAGESIWSDPSVPGFFDPYIRKLSLPNVNHIASLGNESVRLLLRASHFCLLPTLSDTFGYSIIESMAEHTPVIASNICAVPEVVIDGFNGRLLQLDKTDLGDWAALSYETRGTSAYAAKYDEATEHLAQQLVDRLAELVGQPETIHQMRRNARLTASQMFSADTQSPLWDALYDRVAAEDLRAAPVADPEFDTSSPESPAHLLGSAVNNG